MIAPLEHLLRNSIVHGLEDEQQRTQSGKLPIGEIRLSVRQESNEVVFEFSDDGAGLNYAKLREKGWQSEPCNPVMRIMRRSWQSDIQAWAFYGNDGH